MGCYCRVKYHQDSIFLSGRFISSGGPSSPVERMRMGYPGTSQIKGEFSLVRLCLRDNFVHSICISHWQFYPAFMWTLWNCQIKVKWMKGLAFQEKTTGNIVKRSLVFQAVWMKTFPLHPFFKQQTRQKGYSYNVFSPRVYQGTSSKTIFPDPHHRLNTHLVLSWSLYWCCVVCSSPSALLLHQSSPFLRIKATG